MAKFTANHDKLYFDTLCRTKKAESVLSLIQATYQVKKDSTVSAKEEIAEKLVHAYELFKGTSGTYAGDPKQFESQYTIGHELCIWKNGNLDLTDLAIKVAENRITIRDYFDIVFLNYIQPVNNIIVHILYHLLVYMKENHINRISKEDMTNAYKNVCGLKGENYSKTGINGAYNMLLGSNYFKEDSMNKELIYSGPCSIDELISRCDTTYVTKGYEVAKEELKKEKDYIKYLLQDYRYIEEESTEPPHEPSVIGGENIIFYGVPGVGKSYEINSRINPEHTDRIVFHPDYTYSDFTGQILPRLVPDEENPSVKKLNYVFEAGPFTRILKRAETDKNNMYYLVIEEINRGNAPAIFGDIFQLLDRDDNGASTYSISNYDVAEEVYSDGAHQVKIPSNLSIYATMNTSDQNVFTLDTAFQRRWQMHLIKNDISSAAHATQNIDGSKITWGDFAEVINNEIISFNENMGSSEDKRLGAYFVGINELTKNKFTEKVIKYLWDDAFKMDHSAIFNSEITTLDEIIQKVQETSSDSDILKNILTDNVYLKMLHNNTNYKEGEK